MKFYDLCIQAKESSIAEIAKFAEQLGYSGIAICNDFQSLEKLNQEKNEISEIKSNIEVHLGAKIHADNKIKLNELINKIREHVTVLVVAGGNYEINRAACENSKVDILAHPEFNRFDNGLDEACLGFASINNVAIEVDFRQILYSYRKPRSYILDRIATNIRLCDTLRVPLIICSGAQGAWDMRDPRGLIAIVNVLGIDLGKAFSCFTSTPQQIIERNRKKLEGKIPTEGVEVI